MIKRFDLNVLHALAKILGDPQQGLTGREIGTLLEKNGFPDPLFNAPKWERLYASFQEQQTIDRCANKIGDFLQAALLPAKHYQQQDWYRHTTYQINQILSFEGWQLGEEGKLKPFSKKTSTVAQAKSRASQLKEALILRQAHPDIYPYCREELLQENYFHSVFEATQSVADKIRQKTGLTIDGSQLVDAAFSFHEEQEPPLALNALQSESEQSEHLGFMNLLKGLFGTFQPTTGQSPQVTWPVEEQDALDIFAIISMVHRRLDEALETRKLDATS